MIKGRNFESHKCPKKTFITSPSVEEEANPASEEKQKTYLSTDRRGGLNYSTFWMLILPETELSKL